MVIFATWCNGCSKLQLEYVDLLMIHWPLQLKKGAKMPPREGDFLPFDLRATWATLEQCVEKGLTKSIGVSNFNVKILNELMSFAKIPPVVNQVNRFNRNESMLGFNVAARSQRTYPLERIRIILFAEIISQCLRF